MQCARFFSAFLASVLAFQGGFSPSVATASFRPPVSMLGTSPSYGVARLAPLLSPATKAVKAVSAHKQAVAFSVAAGTVYLTLTSLYLFYMGKPMQRVYPELLIVSTVIVDMCSGVIGLYLARVWEKSMKRPPRPVSTERIVRRMGYSIFVGAISGFFLYGGVLTHLFGEYWHLPPWFQALFHQLILAFFVLDFVTFLVAQRVIENRSWPEALAFARPRMKLFSWIALVIFLPTHLFSLMIGQNSVLMAFTLSRLGSFIWNIRITTLVSDVDPPADSSIFFPRWPAPIDRFIDRYSQWVNLSWLAFWFLLCVAGVIGYFYYLSGSFLLSTGIIGVVVVWLAHEVRHATATPESRQAHRAALRPQSSA